MAPRRGSDDGVRRLDGQATPSTAGWSAQALDRAMWESSAAGIGLWQLVAGLVAAWGAPRLGTLLVVGHASFAVLALATVRGRGRVGRATYFHLLFALLTLDLVLADDRLTATVCCLTFVVAVTPFLVMERRSATVLTGGWVGLACLAVLTVGHGRHELAVAVALPAACYSVAAALLVTGLRRVAHATDRGAEVAAAEREQLVRARAHARTRADLARALHDTVVNTLGFLASERAGTADPAQVRRRCAEDLRLLRALGSGDDPAGSSTLEDAVRRADVTVAWTGASAGARRELLAAAGPDRARAVTAIVGELVQNADKHAGVRRVTVDVEHDGDVLVVTVTDDGRGFDPERTATRGLEGSVRRRAADHGLAVTIDSSPGAGTRAEVRCPLGGPPTDVDAEAEAEVAVLATRIRRTGTWGWCVAVSLASLVTGAIGTGTPATYASVLVVAARLGAS
jgi:signal transduction histidine kinase